MALRRHARPASPAAGHPAAAAHKCVCYGRGAKRGSGHDRESSSGRLARARCSARASMRAHRMSSRMNPSAPRTVRLRATLCHARPPRPAPPRRPPHLLQPRAAAAAVLPLLLLCGVARRARHPHRRPGGCMTARAPGRPRATALWHPPGPASPQARPTACAPPQHQGPHSFHLIKRARRDHCNHRLAITNLHSLK